MKKIILLLLLLPSYIYAQEVKFPYETIKKQEIYIYGAAGTLWGSYLLGNQWKNSLNEEDVKLLRISDVNKIDRFACYNYNTSLNNTRELLEPISTVLAIGGTFAMSYLNDYKEDNTSKLIVMSNMYIQGLLLTTGIVQSAKTYINRARPFTYNKEVGNARMNSDNNESFMSGNASLMFYNSVFIAKTFSDIYPNSKYRKWVWAGTLAISCTSAYMSVQSGHHFLTDVLTGAAVGSLIGYFIPVMHYKKDFKYKKTKFTGSISPLLLNNGLGMNLVLNLH